MEDYLASWIRKTQSVNSQTGGPTDPTQSVQVSSVTKIIFQFILGERFQQFPLLTVITTVIHVFATLTLKDLNMLWLSGYQKATWKLNMHLSGTFHFYSTPASKLFLSDSKDSFLLVSCDLRKSLHAYANP